MGTSNYGLWIAAGCTATTASRIQKPNRLDRQTIILVNEGKTVNPLVDFAIPALQKGAIAYNYAMDWGLRGFASLLPLVLWVAMVLGIGTLILVRKEKRPIEAVSTPTAVSTSSGCLFQKAKG